MGNTNVTCALLRVLGITVSAPEEEAGRAKGIIFYTGIYIFCYS